MTTDEENLIMLLQSGDLDSIALSIELQKGINSPIFAQKISHYLRLAQWYSPNPITPDRYPELIALVSKPYTNRLELYLDGKQCTYHEPIEKLLPLLKDLPPCYKLILSNYDLKKTIPPEICDLETLQDLSISSCNITDFQPLSPPKWQDLFFLNLSGNQLTTIPDGILAQSSITRLYLGYNKIEHISNNIDQMKNLGLLYLNYNKITDLPDQLAQLENLVSLSLRGNALRHVPQCLFNMNKSLQYLDLSQNKIANQDIKLLKKTLKDCNIVLR